MSDSEIADLIDLWRGQPALWDITIADYSNADVRKKSLQAISQQMEGLDTGTY